MRRDDRDDPFDEFFREIERMMNDVMGDANFRFQGSGLGESRPTADVHLDLHESDDEIRVVADLPGVEKEEIGLKCDGSTLTVDADSPQREYHERVRLPGRVDEHSASATYNNGVLEVTFDREDDSTSIGLE